MPLRKTKASAFQIPEKFNFLTGGKPPRPQHRQWPIGISPDDATRKNVASMHDLKEVQRGAK